MLSILITKSISTTVSLMLRKAGYAVGLMKKAGDGAFSNMTYFEVKSPMDVRKELIAEFTVFDAAFSSDSFAEAEVPEIAFYRERDKGIYLLRPRNSLGLYEAKLQVLKNSLK